MPVAEALARVLDHAAPLPAERVPLREAHGRVLTEALAALRTQPPADVSAMDGYAVRAADVATAPVTLKLIGEVAAGHPFERTVGAGEAVRIFTGGVMPPGADTVVIQENASRAGEAVTLTASAARGRNVRVEGLDFTRGAVLLAKGTRLSGRDLALAAAMNHPSVPVHRRPKVAVLATGDELVAPGSTPGPGEIVYSNGFATMAMAETEGATVIDLGIVPDRVEATVAAVRKARAEAADILVTSGGASVGEHDLVQRSLAAEGLALSFWKVAVRPGRPMMHGRLGAMHVLGLPGNPVSAYVTAFLFLVPLIRKLAGRRDLDPVAESAVLGRDLPANDERQDYLRAELTEQAPGRLLATPVRLQDSSLLAPLARAGCLIVRAPHAPAAKAGEPCSILKLGI
jgi:molybdopterin molybdotransferase